MKRFMRNKRGQFVIIAALLIAILTLSVAFSVQQINLHRQQLRYKPVEEIVLAITSDLDRCLTYALSKATQQYYETKSEDNAVSEGNKFISKWVRSVIASYAHLGISMAMSANLDPGAKGPFDVNWEMDWSHPRGISEVWTKFYLSIDAYGFKGWVGRSSKSVSLEIFPESIITHDHDTTLQFRIRQGTLSDSSPVPNLARESLNKTKIHIREDFWVSSPELEVTDLTYLGDGVYSVSFNHQVNKYTHGIILTVTTPEDNIIVSALYFREAEFFINLQSQRENSLFPTNEGMIQFDGINYTLPVESLRTLPGEHLVKYYPSGEDTFLNWTTTEGIVATNPTNPEGWTWININNNGTITAFYKSPPQPVILEVTLDSREWDNSTRHLGNIVLDATTYMDLPAPNVTLTSEKRYYIEYEPENSSYYFWGWEGNPPGNFIFDNSAAQSTNVKLLGNGTIVAVYSSTPPPTPQLAYVDMHSQEENSPTPTNLGLMQLAGKNYTLPVNSLEINIGFYSLEYFPKEGYQFLNWTTAGAVSVNDPYSPLTTVMINGNGSITAFYSGCKIILESRQWDNSSFNLGTITLGANTYALPKTLTGLAGGKYQLQYTPQNSSYQFLWWDWTGDIIPEDPSSASTTLTVYGDGNVTAIYSLPYEPPPSTPVEWDKLYLVKVPEGSLLLPYSMLPQHYFNPRSSTLPIPPRPYEQRINVTSPPTPYDITLARYVNVSIYIQLASGKADYIKLELKFTYKGVTYLLNITTFYNLVGEAWYEYSIDIDELDKADWPVPFQPIIPANSTVTLTVVVPPNSGTLHIVYGWNRYQSCVDLF